MSTFLKTTFETVLKHPLFYINDEAPVFRRIADDNSKRFKVSTKILDEAYAGNINALMLLSELAKQDNRLGLAREFLRLALIKKDEQEVSDANSN